MNIDELKIKLESLHNVIKPLANIGQVEEYALASAEALMQDLVENAKESNLSENSILFASRQLLQTFILISESHEIPLSDETEGLLCQAKAAGIPINESRKRLPSRPLSSAPTGPPESSIFVDESGTASFEETIQPVLCLVAIIVKDNKIPDFEHAANGLLSSHGLPKELELHAQEFLTSTPIEPLNNLTIEERYNLLYRFLSLGMDHSVGVHHISMLKDMVKPEFKQKMLAQGLNAYTHTFVWFLITLDRACLLLNLTDYKYFYDRTDAYRKSIDRIFRSLESNKNKRLQLLNLKEPPVMVESHKSRLIQLADIAGYYLNRYRQFEVTTYEHRKALEKHKDKIFRMYDLIQPKLVNYLGRDLHLTVDWEALSEFSLNG